MMAISNLDYLPTLSSFDYLAPKTIEEACSLLSKYKGRAKVIAGGTDLLISMKKRQISPRYVVSIKGIPDLNYIHYNKERGLKIGALATLQSIASSPIIKEKFGPMATACNKIGIPQVRNMGTIGGNICNAGPSQDSIPALLVLDAKLKLVGLQSERIVAVDKFFTGPFQTALGEAELLTEIQIPAPSPRSYGCYQWLTKITEADETLVGVAVLITVDSTASLCKDIKIGLCSVSPIPIRARQAEEMLRGEKLESKIIEQAAQAAAEETRPRSRADYRRQLTSVLVKRAVNEVWQRIK
jgi:carbon-monoxide dehydrogenase medium subunit